MIPPIRVSIVEDDRATREGFLKLLKHAPQIVCFGAYANTEEALSAIPSMVPDVVLVDINLPGRNGIDCVAALKHSHPTLQFLMLTTYEDSERIFASLRAGASGYLLKRGAPDELISAVEEVMKGGAPMSMQIARKVVAHFHQIQKPAGEMENLTKRESQILDFLAKGLLYKQIADRLGISTGTVHTHLHTIYGKLHVQSRTEAVVKYLGK